LFEGRTMMTQNMRFPQSPHSTQYKGNPLVRTPKEGLPSQIEITNYLAKIYPEESPEWKLFCDRWGLFSDTPNKIVKKILLATTPTGQVRNYFIENDYDLLVGHHDFLVDVPQVIMHIAMDIEPKGHNGFFAKRFGFTHTKQIAGIYYHGFLPKPLLFNELSDLLERRGFKVDGCIWSKDLNNKPIHDVLYCSGMGGLALTHAGWENTPLRVNEFKADVFITGELTSNIDNTPHRFDHIIELGHTNSEKPLFQWIRNYLKNRWENLEIDLADNSIDFFGRETYKAKEKFMSRFNYVNRS